MEWYKVQVSIGDKHAARIKRAFLNRTLQTRDATAWSEVEKAIPAGAMVVYNTIQWGKWLPGEQVKPAYGEMYERSRLYLQKYAVEKAEQKFVFDPETFRMPNPEAERWLLQWSATEITNLARQDRDVVREVLSNGMKDKKTVKQIAKELKQVIGLNERQYVAWNNYRANLIKNGMSPARVETLSEKYYNKLAKYRAETVGLTESHTATNEAWSDQVRTMTREGTLDARRYEMSWLVTPDDRLCEVCQAMVGSTSSLEAQNFNGVGIPPRHPRCRCVTIIKRKY